MLHGTEAETLLSERIIGCAIAVHRALGPGLLESVYESAMCLELAAATYLSRDRSEYRSITEVN